MHIGSSFDTAKAGIFLGFQQVSESAQVLAAPRRAQDTPSDNLHAMVGLNEGQHQVQASAATLKASNDALGTLINTFA